MSEHWLYRDELSFLDTLNTDFHVISCSSSQNDVNQRWKRGQGGVAIFIRKDLVARELHTASDRIVAATISIGEIILVIVAVYFPSTNYSSEQFINTLDSLEQFCIEQKSRGQHLVLLGDFNAHVKEPSLSQDWNSRGRKLKLFCDKLNIVPANISPVCEFPRFTYISRFGNSIVDYVIIENELLKYVQAIEVLNEHPDNVVFHQPLSLELCLPFIEKTTLKSETKYLYEKISWKRCTPEDIENYRSRLRIFLQERLDKNPSDVNLFCDALANAIKFADLPLPRVKFKSALKPYWTDKLKSLRKLVMAARAEWISWGSPRCCTNNLYKHYKKLKCEYRRKQRKASWEFEQKEFSNIANLNETDHDMLWKLLNSRVGKGKQNKKSNILVFNDETVTDPQKIVNLWADYYESLFSPLHEGSFNYEFFSEVNKKVDEVLEASASNVDYTFSTSLTVTEIAAVIQRLPNGKSPGYDGITYEHLKYGGEIITQILLKLYNCITEIEEIPKSFKLAIKIPIPKKNKEVRSFDNHRGISLLTSFNKVLERIVLSRLQKNPNNSHHSLQGGYQKEQDALTTCFVIDEVIKHCCEENEKVYVAYMDISKAFDTMWINGMLYKLYYNKNISGKAWRLIRHWYLDMQEFVFIEGTTSRTYELFQGTRQGGVLSPWLFLVFIDDLIQELDRINAGISLNSVCYGSPMFADDLTMLSRMKPGLDRMLQTAWNFCRMWRFNFNLKNTVILTFGESKMEHDTNRERRLWKLGSSALLELQVWSNLGKTWHIFKDNLVFISNALQKGREACYTLVGMGARHWGDKSFHFV